MEEVTRKLKKMLDLSPDEIYHVFCLALCVSCIDGKMTEKEGELLTRLGFGLGLTPQDIEALTDNARQAIKETSISDVIAFSLARLKTQLTHEQLGAVKQILRHVAAVDREILESEKALLELVQEIWED
ncbi:MAG: TerB family tellurite resistance protein [bacterium]|nr:TerB family tellurite resistance protein [Candidatus Sumerlaeota bacterium]